jgi:hypothetical protein
MMTRMMKMKMKMVRKATIMNRSKVLKEFIFAPPEKMKMVVQERHTKPTMIHYRRTHAKLVRNQTYALESYPGVTFAALCFAISAGSLRQLTGVTLEPEGGKITRKRT